MLLFSDILHSKKCAWLNVKICISYAIIVINEMQQCDIQSAKYYWFPKTRNNVRCPVFTDSSRKKNEGNDAKKLYKKISK